MESLRQMAKEGRAFVAGEYRGSGRKKGARPSGDEASADEERTLTIAASEYVEGLYTIL